MLRAGTAFSRLLKEEFGQCLAMRPFLSRHLILAPRDAPDPGEALWHAGAAVLYGGQITQTVEQLA
ncbi:MAG: hypothetical protein CVT84_06305 [Alphaproteobacteria bacterium HGW-Alphaproteobacteria-6]|nr:MAG: hypothetical protein CVT84_06305 [Alphaproteobacteria bacterium HGW-Alphaproteobacteria-6]